MASTFHVVLCAVAALAIWGCVGLAVGRAVMPTHMLAAAVAPALGWAVHSAVALPVFMLVGFSRATVAIFVIVSLTGSCYALLRQGRHKVLEASPSIPWYAVFGALVLAFGIASAILPKVDGDAVYLAPQIFDHSKIAMIDEMIRNGLPPANPFFGQAGQPSRLAYYYLMHFSAAELSLLFGFSGWEGDAALTWFTAFASIMLMTGLAVWLSGRRIAALLTLVITAASSLRPLLAYIPGIDSIIQPASGFGSWLFQTAWAPQHVAAASCVVLAVLLLVELARRANAVLVVTLALVAVAGFESSVWVGGVTFAVSATWTSCVLLAYMDASERLPFLGRCALAAFGAGALSLPFALDQSIAGAERGITWPVALQVYEVIGDYFSPVVSLILNLPSFWMILLPIEMPAVYIAGLMAIWHFARSKGIDPDRKRLMVVIIHLAAASMTVSWLMVSTVGGGNDLGWRAVLPGIIIVTAFAAAGLTHWLTSGKLRLVTVAGVAIALGLPGGAKTLYENVRGVRGPAAKVFAATPELWAAVRKHAGPADRVANNPIFLEAMTPWPVNISWALLSNRRSCYAGYHLAVPFLPLPVNRLLARETIFRRVFAGEGQADDLKDMIAHHDCQVAVVTQWDGAWTRDPFADHPQWRLAESGELGWRIYVENGHHPPGFKRTQQ